jgi:predicted choloylglycine hydrolase
MSSSPTPVTPAPGNRYPDGLNEAYGFNLKMLAEETLKDLRELTESYQQQALQTLTDAHAQSVKTITDAQNLAQKTNTDAQNAANVHLLNIIGTAHKLSEATVNSLANVFANMNEEQEETSDVTIDDVAKLMESQTTILAKALDSLTSAQEGIAAAMQAIAANMATGRPPANVTGAATGPVPSPAGT